MGTNPNGQPPTFENKKAGNTNIFRKQSEVNCLIEQRYDKNHRQPRYSKRPHDLPAREKNKITFAQPTLRILQNRPYTTK